MPREQKRLRRSIIPILILFVCFALAASGCQLRQTGGDTGSPPVQEESESPLQVFLFFSDTQADPETGDYTSLGELLTTAVAKAEGPDLIVLGGDMVNDGGDADEWREFWKAAETPFSGMITAAVPGNHDNYPLLAEQFDYPEEAPVSPGSGYFYSFQSGPIHFVMLDSNIMGAANDRDIQWLRSDLDSAAAKQATWRIAVMHHPMWPVAENPKDSVRAETMREFFLPIFEEYGVDLILCGHQHNYARSLPMTTGTGSRPSDSKVITQIMAASGAKGPYATGKMDHIAVSADPPNYLQITADDKELTVAAFDGNGKQFDTFTLIR